MDQDRLALVVLVAGAWGTVAVLTRRRAPTAVFAALVGLAWCLAPFLPGAVLWHRGALVHLLLAGGGWLPRTWTARTVLAVSYLAAVAGRPWTVPWFATLLAGALVASTWLEGRAGRLSPARLTPWRAASVVAATACALPPVLASGGLGREWAEAVLLGYGMLLLVVALLVILAVGPRRGAWATDLAVDLHAPPRDLLEQVLSTAGHDPVHVREEAGLALAAARGLQGRLAARQDELARTVAQVEEAAARLLRADEEERRALGREASTGPVTRVRSAVATLERERERAAGAARSGRGAAGPALARSLEHLAAALEELEALSLGLVAPTLRRGLVAALEALRDSSSMPVTLLVRDVERLRALPAAVQECVYYVAAEALANAHKHAAATAVLVEVTAATDVRLRVSDDGVGVAEHPPSARGAGIAGMAQRAAEVGGVVTVTSPTGGGTRVSLTVPQPGAAPLAGPSGAEVVRP